MLAIDAGIFGDSVRDRRVEHEDDRNDRQRVRSS